MTTEQSADRVKIVADVGSNWRDGPDEPLAAGQARWADLIRMCAEAGVDAVKAQYLRRTAYPPGSAEEALVRDYEWPTEWLPWLRETCAECGVEFLCTVFDRADVATLDPHVLRWKIASFEALHFALLDACHVTKKPLIVSTGTLSEDEVRDLSRRLWARDTLLLCVSKYPAFVGDYDLTLLGQWQEAYGVTVGLSDHTHPDAGPVLAVGAVAAGARVVETHVTLYDGVRAPDAHFSRTPRHLEDYVAAVRTIEEALGTGYKEPVAGELRHYRYNPALGRRGTLLEAVT